MTEATMHNETANQEAAQKEPATTEQAQKQLHNGHAESERYYRPNVDIVELPDELVLYADTPGARGDSIDVSYENGELTVRAAVEPRQPDANYLLREYGVGGFVRTFRVGDQIDASRISAEYANGVLKLHLPKAEAARPRKIVVN
jgi:HSP20 family molecular chaperone IbpA